MSARGGRTGEPQPPGHVPQRIPRRGRIPYEAQVFGRMALFGVGIGAAYWFLTYETAGSILLVTFGAASGIAATAITLGAWRATRHLERPEGEAGAGRPAAATDATGDSEPIPSPGWTPLLVSVGLGLVALGGALGPWLLIAGLLVVVLAARAWLSAAMAETDAARGLRRRDRDD